MDEQLRPEDAHRELAAHVAQAAALAAPPASAGPPSLSRRVASRLRSTAALLFTARQKQFNIASAAALEGLFRRIAELEARLTDARHELAMLRADSEPPHFRPGTLDEAIWADVNRHNEYVLPDRFAPADVVLDVGGHIGSFGFACLRRGAGAVVAYEPDASNFAAATLNLARFGTRAEVRHGAVWRSDGPTARLRVLASFDPANTGGGVVEEAAAGDGVEATPLDVVLSELVTRHRVPRIRLLKLDCEGSEYPILLTSRALHLVEQVCGEYHESAGRIPDAARVSGVEIFDRETLKRGLESNGFQVDLRQHTTNPNVGLFFATRPSTGT